MLRKFVQSGVALLVTLTLLTTFAYGGAPLEAVRMNVNKVLDVLRDQTLASEAAKEKKKAKLRPIYSAMFDEEELSRRTLSRHWSKLNPAQQKEFVQLFQQVLEKTYADKILAYTNEKIEFDGETMLAKNQAEIKTKVVTSSKEIPMNYRVIASGGTWKVYDVIVENISLVQNYRTQFNDILTKQTPDDLLETLRKKVKAQ